MPKKIYLYLEKTQGHRVQDICKVLTLYQIRVNFGKFLLPSKSFIKEKSNDPGPQMDYIPDGQLEDRLPALCV
jgi:hypothetical protein